MPKSKINTVVSKIEHAGGLNKYSTEFAVTVRDGFNNLNRRMDNLETKMDNLTASVDKFHEDSIRLSVWQQVFHSLFSTWSGRIVLVIGVAAVALAGQRILEILKLVPMGA